MSKITLDGTVVGDALVVRRAKLEVGDSTVRADEQRAFAIVTEDGKEIAVEPADGVQLLPLETKSGTWEDLSALPIAKAFRDPPPPDVSVTMEWGEVRGGDRVRVRGTVTHTERHAGSYRGPASSSPSGVRVTHIGIGTRGRSAIDAIEAREAPPSSSPKARPRIGPSIALLMIVLGVLAALGGAFAAESDLAYELDWIVFGCGLALTGAVFHRRSSASLLLFEKRGTQWKLGWLVGVFVTLAIVFLLPAADYPTNISDGHRIYLGTVAFAFWAMWAVLCLVFLVHWERLELRSARRLLFTAPHASPPVDGEWGVSEGTVEDVTLAIEATRVACMSIFEEEWVEGSSPNHETQRAQLAPFSLARADGSVIAVHPDGGLVIGAYAIDGNVEPSKAHKKVMRRAHVIPEGAPALVLGRMKLDAVPGNGDRAKLAPSVGKESLVVFAGSSPRSMLRRRIVSAWILLATLALFATVLAALALYHPFLPDVYSTGGD